MVEPSARDVGKHLVLTKDVTYEARDTYVDEVVKGVIRPLENRILVEPIIGHTAAEVVE